LFDQSRKALFKLYSKIHDDCFNHETLLSLFDTYISCILNYECEVWGSHKVEDIEKIHLNFLKRTLKVRRSTVNFIIYFEIGRVPMYVERRYSKMLKLWCQILKTENIVLAVIHNSNIEVKRSKYSQTFSHFELLECDVVVKSHHFRLCVIYRPPPSRTNKLKNTTFFEEWSEFLDRLVVMSYLSRAILTFTLIM
jgi:hypothetical protein